MLHRSPFPFSGTFSPISDNKLVVPTDRAPLEVRIVDGVVPAFSGRGRISACCELGAEYALIHIPHVAGFQVFVDGVVVAPSPQVDLTTLNHFLYSMAFTFLLHLRGVPVLCASSVVLPNGKAALFCGISTSGKSSVAAALSHRGYRVLADDWVAIQFNHLDEPCVLPLSPDLQLPLDVLTEKNVELQRVRPHLDKFLFPQSSTSTLIPIARIYELDIDDGQVASLSAVRGLERIHTLTRHAYIRENSVTSGRQHQQLEAFVQLAKVSSMHRLTRPQTGHSLTATLDLLEADWA